MTKKPPQPPRPLREKLWRDREIDDTEAFYREHIKRLEQELTLTRLVLLTVVSLEASCVSLEASWGSTPISSSNV